MAIQLRDTSLHGTAFWVLGVTTRDGRNRIVQQAEARSLELDYDVCQKARAELTNPRVRLAAEVAWLPGVAPKRAEQLVNRVLHDPQSVRSESGLPALARANLLVAAFETVDGRYDVTDAAAFLHDIAVLVDGLEVEEIVRDINEDRLVSGFPEVKSEHVEEELANRKRQMRESIKNTLNRLPTPSLVALMTESVDRATSGGESHAPHLLDELVDVYEVEAHEFLQKEAENVSKLLEAARTVAGCNQRMLGHVIDKIESVTRNWDRVAQPIQLSARARGIYHDPSNELAFQIRDLAIDLFNEHNLPAESRRLIALLQDVFAEVPQLAERAEQDADALELIVQDREEWVREITYQAEVGVLFKGTLSISPEGVSWKQRKYPLDRITRVRWGGVKHSVNGIPTGTTYTLAFGDDESEAVVELRREQVYATFLEKLWRAVCVRLVLQLVTTLKSGNEVTFGDAVVRDDSVILKRHKWVGSGERVRCGWHQVQVWSADGSFVIGAKDDKRTYAALSYIHVPNVHILEHLIRMAFKKGIDNLSDVLQGD